jgi:hypothetical protein
MFYGANPFVQKQYITTNQRFQSEAGTLVLVHPIGFKRYLSDVRRTSMRMSCHNKLKMHSDWTNGFSSSTSKSWRIVWPELLFSFPHHWTRLPGTRSVELRSTRHFHLLEARKAEFRGRFIWYPALLKGIVPPPPWIQWKRSCQVQV